MEEQIILDKEIKIMNIRETWDAILPKLKNAEESNTPLEIVLKETENLDGAGVQLILYILHLTKEFPKNYSVSGMTEKIENKIKTFGG